MAAHRLSGLHLATISVSNVWAAETSWADRARSAARASFAISSERRTRQARARHAARQYRRVGRERSNGRPHPAHRRSGIIDSAGVVWVRGIPARPDRVPAPREGRPTPTQRLAPQSGLHTGHVAFKPPCADCSRTAEPGERSAGRPESRSVSCGTSGEPVVSFIISLIRRDGVPVGILTVIFPNSALSLTTPGSAEVESGDRRRSTTHVRPRVLLPTTARVVAVAPIPASRRWPDSVPLTRSASVTTPRGRQTFQCETPRHG